MQAMPIMGALTSVVLLAGGLLGPLAVSAAQTAVPAAQTAVPAAQTAVDYSEGLRVESGSTYTVDLAAGVIHVEQAITLTNEVPDRRTATYLEQSYFPEISTLVLPGATNVAASWAGGGRLPVGVTPSGGGLVDVATVDLVPDLYYGGSKTVRLTYDVPGQPPRSGAVAQVNQAFATLPVFTSADPGLGSVTVVLPAGLDVEVAGADLTSSSADGRVTYTATGIADPDAWLATVIVRNDAALVAETVFFEDKGVRVQAWPGDTEWLAFTSDLVERGLPALRSAIGRPWLVEGQLDVVETSAPYVYGYAGWYEHERSLIEVGDALDPHVTLHEMAHAWFNGEAFDSRWVNEALADEFAALAMAELGMERPLPEPVDPAAPAAVALNDWAPPSLDEGGAQEQEAYGYAASWWVSHALVEEIGADGMSAVINANLDLECPYPAETVDTRLESWPDWRSFLDHLEGVGGSMQASGLFRTFVASQEDLALMDARDAARDAYADLAEAGDGWAPPAVLRLAMAAWAFDDATAMMPQVRDAFAERDRIGDALATIDVAVPTALREEVEGAEDLAGLDRALADAAQAADALVDAATTEAEANPLARLGLLVLPVSDELADARAAFDAGDWDRAEDSALAASSGVGTATTVGALALAVVLVAVLVVLALAALRRRRRSSTPAPFAALPVPVAAVPAPAAVPVPAALPVPAAVPAPAAVPVAAVPLAVPLAVPVAPGPDPDEQVASAPLGAAPAFGPPPPPPPPGFGPPPPPSPHAFGPPPPPHA